ncbi:hypothetical protein B0H17DRAFT_1084999 [Mycena rosella]|uniref:Uncharacterized protein n=1 Tax=Mycena rosella TaxID=1033263 RepID=A0AAD7GAJ2_MYCRO|nr:hypothetical protein B0H17DRAFT_1084999 [Mycena rosella]
MRSLSSPTGLGRADADGGVGSTGRRVRMTRRIRGRETTPSRNAASRSTRPCPRHEFTPPQLRPQSSPTLPPRTVAAHPVYRIRPPSTVYDLSICSTATRPPYPGRLGIARAECADAQTEEIGAHLPPLFSRLG